MSKEPGKKRSVARNYIGDAQSEKLMDAFILQKLFHGHIRTIKWNVKNKRSSPIETDCSSEQDTGMNSDTQNLIRI